jgi:NTP pyrophosphatase (non-canonical NTP hydrolase)
MSLLATATIHADGLADINTLTPKSAWDKKVPVAVKLTEEMAELSQQLLKVFYFGKFDNVQHMYEETADLILLLDQHLRMIDQNQVDKWVVFKINRYKQREIKREALVTNREISFIDDGVGAGASHTT